MVETPTPSLVRVRTLQQQLMFERRLLFFCTGLVGVSVVIWLISISTDYWFIVDGGNGIYINETKRMFLMSNSGLWRICRKAVGVTTATGSVYFTNVTGGYTETQEILNNMTNPNFKLQSGSKLAVIRRCKLFEMFPSDAIIKSNPMLDNTILHYTRTEMIFSVISLLLIMMGFFFSFYTFRNPRYMFKRLAGGIHFITCLSVMVVIEVLMSSIVYEKEHLPVVHPKKADYYYGYSFYLACLVFICNLLAGIVFFWYSKKRKGRILSCNHLQSIQKSQKEQRVLLKILC
ncbi:voltage-dependent calcium channel gamma-1 subunit-like isoform X3 [Lycorma delicatula]|uniref:voltage-dependent calcium channel gamma-1 subunit-like isoform X3 n=1 Tax=Lycorma delicatula TaxID=130591 RepID=UPI003F514E8E